MLRNDSQPFQAQSCFHSYLQHAQQVDEQVGVLVQVEGEAAVVRLGRRHLP
jgi:hypothetical protein